MRGIGRRLKALVQTVKGLPFQVVKSKRVLVAIATILSVAETTVDTQSIGDMISSFIPLIIALISIMIPVMFLKYMMKILSEVLKGFS